MAISITDLIDDRVARNAFGAPLWMASSGGPTLEVMNFRLPVWDMAPGDRIAFSIIWPEWASLEEWRAYMAWGNRGASAGDVRWQLERINALPGSAVAPNTSVISAVTVPAPAQDRLAAEVDFGSFSVQSVSAGVPRIEGFRLTRLDHAEDTLGGAASFAMLRIERQ